MNYIYRYDSPIGRMTMASGGTVLTGLWFDGQKYFASTLSEPNEEKLLPVFEAAIRWLDIYFSGETPDFMPELCLQSTPFRKAVWDILLTIPYGETMTYGGIADILARQTDKIMSAQAVGGAVGHNPLSVIIPCHRVVGADGSMTGYAGGIDRKRFLLELEEKTIKKECSYARTKCFDMPFTKINTLHVLKAERKGRTKEEVNEVIRWLTGYKVIKALSDKTYGEFLPGAPEWNPKAELIKGTICGVRVETIEDPMTKRMRQLDKLIDELAKGMAYGGINVSEIKLEKLKDSDREQFILDNQEAFNYGALEEFGRRDDHFEEDGQIISRETIEQSIDSGEAYRIVCDGQNIGGVIIKVEGDRGNLEILFVSPNVHSKGIGYAAWCEVEELHPEVKVWETVTPYFEKRNIHFYVNRCGFHIVEFFCSHHPDPNDPEMSEHLDEQFPDGMFRFEKRIDK